MDVSGSHTFAAPRERVWNVLLDPDALRASLPSVKEFRQVAAEDYEAIMSVGIGAIKGTYSGKVQVRDKEPPTHYRLLVEGSGRPGFLKGDGLIELEEQGEKTVVRYHGQAQVGGMIAGVGQRLLQASAQLLIGQFFKSMERQLGRDA
jgi:carbon monoxide dehydrogenase subunit G